MTVLADDRGIWLGGSCKLSRDATSAGLVRLTRAGDLETDLTLRLAKNFSGAVMALALDPLGGLLAGGSFSMFGGQAAGGLARIRPTGDLDSDFAARIGSGISPQSSITSIFVQPDGKILLVGDFKTFDHNKVDGIVRLLPTGVLDMEFLKNALMGYFRRVQMGKSL